MFVDDLWQSWEDGGASTLVLLDLLAAFNTFDHGIFLSRLCRLGTGALFYTGSLFCKMHWLPVCFQQWFKVWVTTDKALSGYLKEDLSCWRVNLAKLARPRFHWLNNVTYQDSGCSLESDSNGSHPTGIKMLLWMSF